MTPRSSAAIPGTSRWRFGRGFARRRRVASRTRPLAWRLFVGAGRRRRAIKQFNPAYEEEGYQKGRDYDPNRERAEARRLQRQLRKEARGAARELRKDNRFWRSGGRRRRRRGRRSGGGGRRRRWRSREDGGRPQERRAGGRVVKTQRRRVSGEGEGQEAEGAGGGGGGGDEREPSGTGAEYRHRPNDEYFQTFEQQTGRRRVGCFLGMLRSGCSGRRNFSPLPPRRVSPCAL